MDQTATTPAAAPAGNQQGAQSQPAQQAPAPEWQGTFKTPDDIWKGYTNLKAQYDKKVAELSKPPQQQGTQSPAFDLKDFGDRIDTEFASGRFTDDTKSALTNLGLDPDAVFEFVGWRAQKQLEPLKPFIEGDFDQAIKFASENLEDNNRELFRSLIGAKQYKAAAALIGDAAAKAETKGPAPKIGVVSGDGGGGFNDFADMYKAMKDQRFNYDKEYQAQVKRRFDATPAHVRDEWQKRYTSA